MGIFESAFCSVAFRSDLAETWQAWTHGIFRGLFVGLYSYAVFYRSESELETEKRVVVVAESGLII